MKSKKKSERELWEIFQETGESVQEMSPEEQLEFFRRGADESLAPLEGARRRRERRPESQVPPKRSPK